MPIRQRTSPTSMASKPGCTWVRRVSAAKTCDAGTLEAPVDDDVVGQLLDTAATRLAAYGYVLTGSQFASDELVQAAIVKVSVRHRRLGDVRALEGRVKSAMRTIFLRGLRRAGTWRARLARLVGRGAEAD